MQSLDIWVIVCFPKTAEMFCLSFMQEIKLYFIHSSQSSEVSYRTVEVQFLALGQPRRCSDDLGTFSSTNRHFFFVLTLKLSLSLSLCLSD